MLELKDLHIGYSAKKQTKVVFKNMSAVFAKGELAGLVGNNGIGKSTLLKTLFGTLPPLSGKVLLEGKDITKFSVEELAKNISIVLTDKIGGFNLTVFDVVASGRIPYLNAFGQLKEEDEKITEQSIEQIGIVELKDKFVDELSDGQRQKVMIAKSLAQQTPVILLDEPTAFLDYTSKQQLFKILKQLCREQQKCIIVSSHDLEILFNNSDKVLYLGANSTLVFNEPGPVKQIMNLT